MMEAERKSKTEVERRLRVGKRGKEEEERCEESYKI